MIPIIELTWVEWDRLSKEEQLRYPASYCNPNWAGYYLACFRRHINEGGKITKRVWDEMPEGYKDMLIKQYEERESRIISISKTHKFSFANRTVDVELDELGDFSHIGTTLVVRFGTPDNKLEITKDKLICNSVYATSFFPKTEHILIKVVEQVVTVTIDGRYSYSCSIPQIVTHKFVYGNRVVDVESNRKCDFLHLHRSLIVNLNGVRIEIAEDELVIDWVKHCIISSENAKVFVKIVDDRITLFCDGVQVYATTLRNG